MRHALLIASACLVATPVGAALAQAGGKVTVYRCTDAAGRQSLRDTPCPSGQAQQTRNMLRPKDAPPRPAPAATPAPVATAVPTPVVVYRSPPQPLYECVTPEGDRYTSETGDGRPRWVPLWTLGWPVYGLRPAVREEVRPAPSAGVSIGRPHPLLPPAHIPPARGPQWPHWAATSAGGTWIRDTCAMLPPAEVCNRLRDRRDAIRTRFFNAQEKERDALRLEERGLLARLDNDCGGH